MPNNKGTTQHRFFLCLSLRLEGQGDTDTPFCPETLQNICSLYTLGLSDCWRVATEKFMIDEHVKPGSTRDGSSSA